MSEENTAIDLSQEFIEKLASALDMQAEDLKKGLTGNEVELPEIVPKSIHESAIKNLKHDHEIAIANNSKENYKKGEDVEKERGLRKLKQHYKDQGIETEGIKSYNELIDLIVTSKVGEKSKTEQEFQSMIKKINEDYDTKIKEMESALKTSKIDQKMWEGINLIQFDPPPEIKDEAEISAFIRNKRKDAFILAKAEKKFDIFTDQDGMEHLGMLKPDGEFKKDEKTFANITWADEVNGWAKSKHFNLKTTTVQGRTNVKPTLTDGTNFAGWTRDKFDTYLSEIQEKGQVAKDSKESDALLRKWFEQNPQ